MPRFYSSFIHQIESFQSSIRLILQKNVARVVTEDDFIDFVNLVYDLRDFLELNTFDDLITNR